MSLYKTALENKSTDGNDIPAENASVNAFFFTPHAMPIMVP